MGPDLPPRWMFVKAALFVVLAIGASAVVLLRDPQWTTAACLAVIVWASARAYYFAFHVVQHWIDPGYRFAGLIDLARWCWRRRSRRERASPPAASPNRCSGRP